MPSTSTNAIRPITVSASFSSFFPLYSSFLLFVYHFSVASSSLFFSISCFGVEERVLLFSFFTHVWWYGCQYLCKFLLHERPRSRIFSLHPYDNQESGKVFTFTVEMRSTACMWEGRRSGLIKCYWCGGEKEKRCLHQLLASQLIVKALSIVPWEKETGRKWRIERQTRIYLPY